MFKPKNLISSLLVAATMLVSTITSHATTINIDFNGSNNTTFTGTGVLGGGTWNGFNALGSNLSLLDSTGAASAVKLTLAQVGGVPAFQNTGTGFSGTSGATADLLGDYASNVAGNLTLTLSGLAASTSYNLVGYGVGDQVGFGSTFTGALTGTTTGGQRTSFVQNVNYVQNTNAMSSSGGVITFMLAPNGNVASVLNGLQVSTVATPEPGTIVMMGMGFCLFLIPLSRIKKQTA